MDGANSSPGIGLAFLVGCPSWRVWHCSHRVHPFSTPLYIPLYLHWPCCALCTVTKWHICHRDRTFRRGRYLRTHFFDGFSSNFFSSTDNSSTYTFVDCIFFESHFVERHFFPLVNQTFLRKSGIFHRIHGPLKQEKCHSWLVRLGLVRLVRLARWGWLGWLG